MYFNMYIIYVNNTLPLATDLYMKLHTLNWAAYGIIQDLKSQILREMTRHACLGVISREFSFATVSRANYKE